MATHAYELSEYEQQHTSLGAGIWFRVGRLDGIRFELAGSVLKQTDGHGEPGVFMQANLQVPIYAAQRWRLWVEADAAAGIPSPTIALYSFGIFVRFDRVIFGLRGPFNHFDPSMMLMFGVQIEE